MTIQDVGPVRPELREAISRRGCPVCRLAHYRERRYLASLLEVSRRRAADLVLALCGAHLSLLARLDDATAAGAGVLSVDALFDAWARRIAGSDTAPGSRPTWHASSEDLCAACALGRDASSLDLRELAHALDHGGSIARDYERSDGLCLPHVVMLLRETADGAPDALVARARHTCVELAAQLRMYDRLRARDTLGEPRGAEQTAWARAVALLAGSIEVDEDPGAVRER